MKTSRLHSGAGASVEATLTLFLAGDVMTGRGIDQVLPYSTHYRLYEPHIKDARRYVDLARRHSGPIPDEISFEYLWGDALDALEDMNPDLRVINLETSVTARGKHWKSKQIHYRMHPGNAPLLSTAEIDACVLGNNHTLDWGFDGLRDTLDSLHGIGMATAGAGADRTAAAEPAVLEPGEQPESGRILLFSWAEPGAGAPTSWRAGRNRPGLNILPNLSGKVVQRVIRSVEQHRRNGDRVIVSLHWGGNWGYKIPSKQRTFARALIDAGAADIIYGHSSHHPKGIEVYGGRLILYGCGDLVNDYEGIGGHEEYRSELSLLYFPRLDPSGRLTGLDMIPMKMHRFRLSLANPEEAEWLARVMRRECEAFGTLPVLDSQSLILTLNPENELE